jgi:50S ribosomal subunit-associated GTPase HflX
MDLLGEEDLAERVSGRSAVLVSAAAGRGIDELLEGIGERLAAERAQAKKRRLGP